jgi:hypothetical protein
MKKEQMKKKPKLPLSQKNNGLKKGTDVSQFNVILDWRQCAVLSPKYPIMVFISWRVNQRNMNAHQRAF